MPQIITEEAVRSTVEDRAEERLVYRNAFRDLDASNVNNSTIKVPKPSDAMAEPSAIDPTADYPTTREDYETVAIDRQKFGEMIEIPEEDVMDNIFDLVADHVDLAARNMAEFLDGLAYAELSANLNSEGPVTGDSTTDQLSVDDVFAGIRTLEEEGYEPDMVFVGPRGKEDILKELADRGTDLGDRTVQTGQFADYAGIDWMYSNTGDLTQHDAIVVDSDFYGYEATWTPIETDREEEFDNDTSKFKIKTRKGFKALEEQAAVEING